MSLNLILKPDAQADLEDIQTWYEEKSAGLGAAFHLSFEQALCSILRAPLLGTLVGPDVRRVRLRRYPYSIFYTIEESVVYIHAVLHDRRDPTLWQRRFDTNGHN